MRPFRRRRQRTQQQRLRCPFRAKPNIVPDIPILSVSGSQPEFRGLRTTQFEVGISI